MLAKVYLTNYSYYTHIIFPTLASLDYHLVLTIQHINYPNSTITNSSLSTTSSLVQYCYPNKLSSFRQHLDISPDRTISLKHFHHRHFSINCYCSTSSQFLPPPNDQLIFLLIVQYYLLNLSHTSSILKMITC